MLLELSDNLVHLKGFAASSETLQQAHLKKYHDAEVKYYSMALWRRQPALAPVTTERKFGTLDDPDGYNCFLPSARYLNTACVGFVRKRPVARLDKPVQEVLDEVSLELTPARCSEKTGGMLVSVEDL